MSIDDIPPAIAGCIDLDTLGLRRIWIPPTGRPYWVLANLPNAGPDLTDEELRRHGLMTESAPAAGSGVPGGRR